jgi:hypothetical protein
MTDEVEDVDPLDEETMFFKRFPKEKQDQIRGLVNYVTLMGLTGKDLVSIGGKLDRLKSSQEIKRNKEIVKSFTCLPIGNDQSISGRFKLAGRDGYYKFDERYSGYTVTSYKTKVTKSHDPSSWNLGRGMSWNDRKRAYMLLDIANGVFTLNF